MEAEYPELNQHSSVGCWHRKQWLNLLSHSAGPIAAFSKNKDILLPNYRVVVKIRTFFWPYYCYIIFIRIQILLVMSFVVSVSAGPDPSPDLLPACSSKSVIHPSSGPIPRLSWCFMTPWKSTDQFIFLVRKHLMGK